MDSFITDENEMASEDEFEQSNNGELIKNSIANLLDLPPNITQADLYLKILGLKNELAVAKNELAVAKNELAVAKKLITILVNSHG